jgi:hypothetical protein
MRRIAFDFLGVEVWGFGLRVWGVGFRDKVSGLRDAVVRRVPPRSAPNHGFTFVDFHLATREFETNGPKARPQS